MKLEFYGLFYPKLTLAVVRRDEKIKVTFTTPLQMLSGIHKEGLCCRYGREN